MKSSKLGLASCLLLAALCSYAAPVLVPVRNEVRFIIESDGRTSEVQVEEAPSAEFAAAASDAVRRWRFMAPRLQGQPVRAACKMPSHFRINR